MGKPTGFKEYQRQNASKRGPEERVKDYKDVYKPMSEADLQKQAARCMDCGVPFCHTGCPLGNVIPDWNDMVYRDQWEAALIRLESTNCFSEFTGRICPAPCEEACVLGITNPAVTIRQIEQSVIEHAFANGWVKPNPPLSRTGKTAAVIGSGPAGLAAAMQLNKAGHTVTVFERADRVGGLLRYGIPEFKLEKWVVDRRIKLMEAEGVVFKTGIAVGSAAMPADKLKKEFDAVVICIGSTRPRDLPVPGRELEGVHFAMDFLTRQNKVCQGDSVPDTISAAGKKVIVIGGGDTGSDCVGTSLRHGAESVMQFELFPMPPEDRPANQPWPYWPVKLRTSTSHEEGCERVWSISTKEFIGEGGKLKQLKTVKVEFVKDPETGRQTLQEIPGSEQVIDADLAILAMGFIGPEADWATGQLGVELDGRGNIVTGADYMTGTAGVFCAGDSNRGQSLVVWAISEGREAAHHADKYLTGKSLLPTKGAGDLPRV